VKAQRGRKYHESAQIISSRPWVPREDPLDRLGGECSPECRGLVSLVIYLYIYIYIITIAINVNGLCRPQQDVCEGKAGHTRFQSQDGHETKRNGMKCVRMDTTLNETKRFGGASNVKRNETKFCGKVSIGHGMTRTRLNSAGSRHDTNARTPKRNEKELGRNGSATKRNQTETD